MRGIHRVRVEGTTLAADRLRQYLHKSGYVLVPDSSAGLTLTFEDGALALDSVDSPLEARILANLQELVPAPVLLQRAGGNQDPEAAVITAQAHHGELVARAVFRAIEQVANQATVAQRAVIAAPVVSKAWWRWPVWLVLLVGVLALLLLLPLLAAAQEQPPFQQLDANTGATLNARVFVGLFAPSASGAVAVALPTALGSGGGFKVDVMADATAVTDADDASIATGQSTGLSIGLTQVYDGSVWRRLTIGTAGTASAQVLTVQGITSATPVIVSEAAGSSLATVINGYNGGSANSFGNGVVGTTTQRVTLASDSTGTVIATATNLDVQSGGADLATETTAAALLSNTNYAAAFGTAGTADTQVLSIQGIASMTAVTVTATNLDIQSGGADLATTTQAGAIQTAVELIDDAIRVEDIAETAGTGLAMAGSVRRDVAATSAGSTAENATINTDALGQMWTRQLDPCTGVAKQFFPIDIVTAATTEITPSLAGASTHYYICALSLVTALANNVAVVDDNTDGCGSVTAGIFGGFGSAAEGWNFAANTGIALGSGSGTVGRTTTANAVICIITSAATQLSGQMVVVAAP
jgi:hypothetical protein